MNQTDNSPLGIGPGYRLQWEEAQQCHVLLYPEGMVKLNPSAAEILKLCDSKRKVSDIVSELSEKFADADPSLEQDVYAFLEDAYGRGWIR